MWPFRKGVRRYSTEVREFELGRLGSVRYAQWTHPKESDKEITAELVAHWARFISPGDVALDIGAHTGDTTLPMALAAGGTGCVIAFEPNPYVFEVLRQNSDLNPPEAARIIPYNFAATSRDGRFVFHYSDSGYCNGGYLSQLRTRRHGHGYPLEVEGRNLSRFLRREHPDLLARLRFVKIDTEGYDRTVIETLADILQEFRPVLMAELYKRLVPDERVALADTLHALGYQPHACDGDIGDDLRALSVDDLLRIEHTDLLALPVAGPK